MAKREPQKDVEIIVQYSNDVEGKGEKGLQEIMQRLFNAYIKKVIQNINKGK